MNSNGSVIKRINEALVCFMQDTNLFPKDLYLGKEEIAQLLKEIECITAQSFFSNINTYKGMNVFKVSEDNHIGISGCKRRDT